MTKKRSYKKKKMSMGALAPLSRMKKLSKPNFKKKVKGGATTTLHAMKGMSGVSVYRKAYKTSSGARRILQITTLKKVIKGKR